jgi:hypothetical protein
MTNGNDRVTNNNWCLLNPGNASQIAVYLPFGGSVDIDLRELSIYGSSFAIKWYDPQLGGDLLNGTVTTIQADIIGSLGSAPYKTDQDWAMLLLCEECLQPVSVTSPTAIPTDTPISLNPIPVTLQPSAFMVPPTSSPTTSVLTTTTPAKTISPSQKIQGDANDVGISTKPTGAPRSSASIFLGRLTLSSVVQSVFTYALCFAFDAFMQ